MFKKITAISLAFTIFLSSIVYSPKQSYAIAPAIPAAAYYVLGGGAAAAGLYATDKESLNAFVETAYSNMSDSFKQKMVNATAAGMVGYTFLTNEWEIIRDTVQSSFDAGTNTVSATVPSPGTSDIPGQSTTAYGANGAMAYCTFRPMRSEDSGWNCGGHTASEYTVIGFYRKKSNGEVYYKENTYYAVTAAGWSTWVEGNKLYLKFYLYSGSGTDVYPVTNWWDLSEAFLGGILAIAATATALLNYTGDEAVIDNPGWDWSNDEGERKIGFPFPNTYDPLESAFDWLENKTYSDITTSSNVSVDAPPIDADIDTPALPQTLEDPTSISGWLSGIAGLLRGIWDWIAGVWNKVIGLIKDIIRALLTLVALLNPFSDTFFLTDVLYIPDGFIEGEIAIVMDEFTAQVPWYTQVNEQLDNFRETTITDTGWQGIWVDFPVWGNICVVRPEWTNSMGEQIKIWIGGLCVLMTLLMSVKRIAHLIK